MRFRAKFVPETWLLLLLCGIYAALGLDRILAHRDHWHLGVINLIMAVLAVLAVCSQRTVLWEMDTEGLRHRRLWIYTQIGWQDVTRVESLWSSTFDLKIEYNRHGFGPKVGRILTNPADRDAFVAALHRFAPQAEFVDQSSGKIFNI
jgi:hypothetical protein